MILADAEYFLSPIEYAFYLDDPVTERILPDRQMDCLTVDVEEWFHILDSDLTPVLEQWSSLETRVPGNLSRILDLLSQYGIKATFFWLAWAAERHPELVRRCLREGHEIASHGYEHLLAYKVGPKRFRQDIVRARTCLEDITGEEVLGFRSAGFGITEATPWAFEVIREAGHLYDASIFPSRRRHGGMPRASLVPHLIETRNGPLFEIPTSVVEVFGWRISLFGGGYLRLAPKAIIKWGLRRLEMQGRHLVAYVHPRDIDTEQPRLPLPPFRRFTSYVNLQTTFAKVEWLCRNRELGTMRSLFETWMAVAEEGARSAP